MIKSHTSYVQMSKLLLSTVSIFEFTDQIGTILNLLPKINQGRAL